MLTPRGGGGGVPQIKVYERQKQSCNTLKVENKRGSKSLGFLIGYQGIRWEVITIGLPNWNSQRKENTATIKRLRYLEE